MQIKQHGQQTNKVIRKDCHFFWTYITVHNDSLQIISNTLFWNFTSSAVFAYPFKNSELESRELFNWCSYTLFQIWESLLH